MPVRRTRVCHFCKAKLVEIDYKDVGRIKRCTSGRGKILSPTYTGTCSKHQRLLAKAIKRARFLGLMPYIRA